MRSPWKDSGPTLPSARTTPEEPGASSPNGLCRDPCRWQRPAPGSADSLPFFHLCHSSICPSPLLMSRCKGPPTTPEDPASPGVRTWHMRGPVWSISEMQDFFLAASEGHSLTNRCYLSTEYDLRGGNC